MHGNINPLECGGNHSATLNDMKVVGTLATDGWAVTFGTVSRGLLILMMYKTSTLLLLLLKTYLKMLKHRTSLILSKKLVFISNFKVFILMFVIFFILV